MLRFDFTLGVSAFRGSRMKTQILSSHTVHHPIMENPLVDIGNNVMFPIMQKDYYVKVSNHPVDSTTYNSENLGKFLNFSNSKSFHQQNGVARVSVSQTAVNWCL